MAALHNFRFRIILANLPRHFGCIAPTLRKKDNIRPLQMAAGLAQNAAREHITIAEGIGRVHKHHLYRMLQALILKAVI